MKRKTKVIIIIIVVLIVLLMHIRTMYKDGGSVRYSAILYNVTNYHQLDLDSETGYNDGWDIKVIGIPIYNNFE